MAGGPAAARGAHRRHRRGHRHQQPQQPLRLRLLEGASAGPRRAGHQAQDSRHCRRNLRPFRE